MYAAAPTSRPQLSPRLRSQLCLFPSLPCPPPPRSSPVVRGHRRLRPWPPSPAAGAAAGPQSLALQPPARSTGSMVSPTTACLSTRVLPEVRSQDPLGHSWIPLCSLLPLPVVTPRPSPEFWIPTWSGYTDPVLQIKVPSSSFPRPTLCGSSPAALWFLSPEPHISPGKGARQTPDEDPPTPAIFPSPRREKFLGSPQRPPPHRRGSHSPTPAAPQRRRSCWPSARVTSLQRGRGPRSARARPPAEPASLHCPPEPLPREAPPGPARAAAAAAAPPLRQTPPRP
jgi:hypothetical protein